MWSLRSSQSGFTLPKWKCNFLLESIIVDVEGWYVSGRSMMPPGFWLENWGGDNGIDWDKGVGEKKVTVLSFTLDRLRMVWAVGEDLESLTLVAGGEAPEWGANQLITANRLRRTDASDTEDAFRGHASHERNPDNEVPCAWSCYFSLSSTVSGG